mmetsp:Transcript_12320/g.30143  ORF Transcript_12320/g.30143 Transcript_12320/m.30143 type:complete len:348 (+) Transcript_12320:1660-2703(+)
MTAANAPDTDSCANLPMSKVAKERRLVAAPGLKLSSRQHISLCACWSCQSLVRSHICACRSRVSRSDVIALLPRIFSGLDQPPFLSGRSRSSVIGSPGSCLLVATLASLAPLLAAALLGAKAGADGHGGLLLLLRLAGAGGSGSGRLHGRGRRSRRGGLGLHGGSGLLGCVCGRRGAGRLLAVSVGRGGSAGGAGGRALLLGGLLLLQRLKRRLELHQLRLSRHLRLCVVVQQAVQLRLERLQVRLSLLASHALSSKVRRAARSRRLRGGHLRADAVQRSGGGGRRRLTLSRRLGSCRLSGGQLRLHGGQLRRQLLLCGLGLSGGCGLLLKRSDARLGVSHLLLHGR